MLKIQRARMLPKTPKPYEYFVSGSTLCTYQGLILTVYNQDIIGGTSTGGIIAILLGRLRFSVEICLDFFVSLSKLVYGKERWGWGLWQARFDHGTLEQAIILQLQALILTSPTLAINSVGATVDIGTAHSQGFYPKKVEMYDNHPQACKAFVTAMSKSTRHYLFRTYKTRYGVTDKDCTVWQAIRATSATLTVFDPIRIQDEIFLDGGSVYNNPASIVYEEARTLWPDRDIGCIISLGTGTPRQTSSRDSTLFDRVFPWNWTQMFEHNETECEDTHRELCRRRELKGKYFRLNPKDWLQGVSLEDWLKLDDVIAITDM